MKVELDVISATDTIVCNAAELDVDYVKLGSMSAENVDKGSVSLCEDAETMTVKLKESLPVGKVNLFCAYRGTLNEKMRGFYRSKYTTENGEERHCAVTQVRELTKLDFFFFSRRSAIFHTDLAE
jgi:puromycin-sensitive aminopeptidase